MRFFFTLLSFSLLFVGCKKHSTEADCMQLSEAIATNNVEQAKTGISNFINNLPSAAYTSQNLDKLVSSISGQCTITATVLCFDCIKTLPSQSEIRLSVLSGNTTVVKIIDITYTPDNRMKFGICMIKKCVPG